MLDAQDQGDGSGLEFARLIEKVMQDSVRLRAERDVLYRQYQEERVLREQAAVEQEAVENEVLKRYVKVHKHAAQDKGGRQLWRQKEENWILERKRMHGHLKNYKEKHLQLEAELASVNEKLDHEAKQTKAVKLRVKKTKESVREESVRGEMHRLQGEKLQAVLKEEQAQSLHDNKRWRGEKRALQIKVEEAEVRAEELAQAVQVARAGAKRGAEDKGKLQAQLQTAMGFAETMQKKLAALHAERKEERQQLELAHEKAVEVEKSALREEYEERVQAERRLGEGLRQRVEQEAELQRERVSEWRQEISAEASSAKLMADAAVAALPLSPGSDLGSLPPGANLSMLLDPDENDAVLEAEGIAQEVAIAQAATQAAQKEHTAHVARAQEELKKRVAETKEAAAHQLRAMSAKHMEKTTSWLEEKHELQLELARLQGRLREGKKDAVVVQQQVSTKELQRIAERTKERQQYERDVEELKSAAAEQEQAWAKERQEERKKELEREKALELEREEERSHELELARDTRRKEMEAKEAEHVVAIQEKGVEHVKAIEALKEAHVKAMEVHTKEHLAAAAAEAGEHAEAIETAEKERTRAAKEHAKAAEKTIGEHLAEIERAEAEHAAVMLAREQEHVGVVEAMEAQHMQASEAAAMAHQLDRQQLEVEQEAELIRQQGEYGLAAEEAEEEHVRQLDAKALEQMQMVEGMEAEFEEQSRAMRKEHEDAIISMLEPHQQRAYKKQHHTTQNSPNQEDGSPSQSFSYSQPRRKRRWARAQSPAPSPPREALEALEAMHSRTVALEDSAAGVHGPIGHDTEEVRAAQARAEAAERVLARYKQQLELLTTEHEELQVAQRMTLGQRQAQQGALVRRMDKEHQIELGAAHEEYRQALAEAEEAHAQEIAQRERVLTDQFETAWEKVKPKLVGFQREQFLLQRRAKDEERKQEEATERLREIEAELERTKVELTQAYAVAEEARHSSVRGGGRDGQSRRGGGDQATTVHTGGRRGRISGDGAMPSPIHHNDSVVNVTTSSSSRSMTNTGNGSKGAGPSASESSMREALRKMAAEFAKRGAERQAELEVEAGGDSRRKGCGAPEGAGREAEGERAGDGGSPGEDPGIGGAAGATHETPPKRLQLLLPSW
jgi:hypothetical protein